MTQNLTKDTLTDFSNSRMQRNSNRKKKSSSPLKIAITVIVSILIIIALIVAFCIYKTKSETNAFNNIVSSFNTLLNKSNKLSNDNLTINELSSYATSLDKISKEFTTFSNTAFLSKENKIQAKHYENLAKYSYYKENISISFLNIMNEITTSFSSSPPGQIQGFINKLQNLLTSNDFIQMTNFYNENPYVQENIPNPLSPSGIKNSIDSKLSILNKSN